MIYNINGQKINLKYIFEDANKAFLEKNKILFDVKISERTLCGALMIELYEEIKKYNYIKDVYSVDVEYNKKDVDEKIVNTKKVYCDLIVHKRNNNQEGSNLICLEMKKSKANKKAKEEDRKRIKCLTSQKKEYRYKLGIYYEIKFKEKTEISSILIEYYKDGKKVGKNSMKF
ncbi:MAG: hypothetical protein Q4D47_03125 [Erysipelotrichaceae bacterium]|nr:hypothetical protein [Erysipelotrichaceae bacterium]